MATRNNVNPEPASDVTPAAVPDVTPAATPPDLEYVKADAEEVKPDDPRRMVKIKLHMDKKKGKGLYVNVNDYRYFIPRGEVVEVPYYIAAVINNSAKQDEETAKLIERYGESADF